MLIYENIQYYFSDQVVAAMCDPVMVLPRKPTLEEMEEGKPARVPVARLTSRENTSRTEEDNAVIWKYVEVWKNRVFESDIPDVEAAYQDFLLSLNRKKEEKTEKFEVSKTKQETEMVLIMKCVIIAYLDSLQDSEMTKINPDDIEGILTQNATVLHTVMGAYFKTGIALATLVNNPKRVYQRCVTLHCNGIRQAVAGQRKLSLDENDIYIEAMTIIRDSM